MKIIQINSVCSSGSTGRICEMLSKKMTTEGIPNLVLYTNNKSQYPLGKKYATLAYVKIQALFSRINGKFGFNTILGTKKLIKILEKERPDIVHLHDLHGHNVNISMLFKFIRKKNIKVIWTFHDCWPFTGYCTYFDLCKCTKWNNCCCKCPQFKNYSFLFDRSSANFKNKIELFNKSDVFVVTPSKWLMCLVENSKLLPKKIGVINNGINLEVFYHRKDDYFHNYHIIGKKVVLGVASVWERRKGLDIFLSLSTRLPDDYIIVLVGIKKVSKPIVCISRTDDQNELAQIYSSADVFLNPTREENFPTVNMESIACGTPVITFNTGGSPEVITADTGVVVPDDIDSIKKAILSIAPFKKNYLAKCEAASKRFDNVTFTERYINLYKDVFCEE